MSTPGMSTIQFDNDISIQPLSRDEIFQGLGEVRANGVLLRNARRPIFVEIRTPRGELMRDFRITSTQGLPGGGQRIEFAMNVERGGLMEWMVHEVRNRYNASDWSKEPQPAKGTVLSLELKPLSRAIGGREYSGFSYQYFYQSDEFPIYKILDRSTWEIGGSILNSEFWLRSAFIPSITRFQNAAQFYSSEWYLPDCANPSAFQFLPLQTELSGFSFAASQAGVLLTWPSEVAHIRSLFEKPRGEELMVHLHEHCGDLNHEFATSPVEVLFCPGGLGKAELFNAYEAARDMVSETLHAQIGMRRERVTTYGGIEEWGPPDMEYYARQGAPKLLDAGCETVYIANHFQNNMNTWAVGNMCCTVDYQVSENVGEDKLRAFCGVVRAVGATPEMWANTSISTLTWIFDWERERKGTGTSPERIHFLPREGSIMEALRKSETPFVRNASNAVEADHYTPIFCALNLRDEAVRAYWLLRWREANQNIGLGGIFLDSSYNLSSDKFHWVQNAKPETMQGATADQTHLLGSFRPREEPPSAILSQYHAHLELMREMQEIGYVYGNEDLGVFGVHRHGPGIEMRLDSLPLWCECIANFDYPAIEKTGADPDDVFFRGLAYRLMWMLNWDIKTNALSWHYSGVRNDYDRPSETQLAWFQAFKTVGGEMQKRTVLSDENGVLWRNDARRVIWAFQDFDFALDEEAQVCDVMSGDVSTHQGAVRLARHRVYLLGDQPAPEGAG